MLILPVLLASLVVPAAGEPAARPRIILLIRHAEKPPADDPSVGLSDAGVRRAELLPRLFRRTDDRPDPLSTPDVLVAARNSDRSHRPVRTLKPLAAALGLDVRADVRNEDFPKLADELARPEYAGKVVLVCWHHGNLPALATKLGATDVPHKWPDEVFDRVWQLTYAADGTVTFCSRPQRLLPGDR